MLHHLSDLGTCNLILETGIVSNENFTVPDHILKPKYYDVRNQPSRTDGRIEIKNEDQIMKMRESCRLAANILKQCGKILKVNYPTIHLGIGVIKFIIF